MAAKSSAASVDKLRKGIQERTGVTLSSRSSEPLPVLSNANRARNTEKVLEELGQRDQARGANTFSVEAAKSGSPIMSGWVNAMADNPKLANAATFLAGASLPYGEFRRQQDEKMKGTLTDEMKSAGLTQADLDAWNRQQNEIERQNVLSQYAKEHPIMSSLNAIPENAFGSIEGNIDKVLDFVKGNPIESKQTNADIYRQAVNENIDSKLGRGAYNVANSVGDMLFAAWLTGGLGGGGAEGAKGLAKLLKGLPAASVMGLEKSNATMNSAAERGLSNNQTLAEGVLSGLSTAATEALPFGRFSQGGSILGSMAAEGLQEGAEGLLDTFFDELVTRVGGNGDKSELKTRYREYLNAGYNSQQARDAVAKDYASQVLMDVVMGGAAGGIMQAGSNAVSGRNIITGKIPSLNQNTEAQTETAEAEQPKEEVKVEQTVEQPVQTEQPIPTVQQTPVAQNENIPAVEQTTRETVPQEVQNYVNNRDQLVNYVTQNQPGYEEGQQIIRSINAMDEYMFQNYPEWMDGETGQFKREEFDRLMQSQPTQQSTEQLERDNDGLDEETANLTAENAGQALDNAVNDLDKGSHRYNVEFFSENEESPDIEEDNKLHTGKFKESEFANNSYRRSKVLNKGEYKSLITDDLKRVEAVTHEASLNAAEEKLKRNGFNNEFNRLVKDEGSKEWDAVDTDTAMMCAMREAQNARKAAKLGVDPDEAWNREVQIFKKVRDKVHTAGQMIEALKKWSANTPEGKLAQAIAYVKQTVKEEDADLQLKEKAQKYADGILTDEFMKEFLKKAHQYDGQEVSFAKEARLNIELAHMLNEQIPVKFRQKFTTLWLDNLLASFRTLISRNFGGNIGKAALDQTLVKAFSGPIDAFVSRYTGTRTTTGFTVEGLKTYGKGFKKGGKQTIMDYWTPDADPDFNGKLKDLAKEFKLFADANVTNRAGVDENNITETFKNNRTTFKNGAFKLYDKLIKFGLAIGDNPFYQANYDQTVYELNTLLEKNKIKIPEGTTKEQLDNWVKAVATAQGLEAVYQDNSKLAQGATDIKNGLAKMSQDYVGFDILSGASMPFVRTPMNVVKTNLELSPLGIVKNAVKTISEIKANLEAGRAALDSASFDQRRFVRETSRNVVGLIMFATGLMLKNAGMLTGGYSDDAKEKQAQKEAGMQEYAFVSPFTGNQWSVNWIPGIGSSLVSASAFEDEFSKPDQDGLDALVNGIKAGSQSMFEQAALQGLQRLTGSANYSSDNKLIDNVAETISNTASSAILPSFVRQTAAALDPYKRNTYGAGGKESVINNAIAGVPLLRQTLQPRIGTNGEPMAQNAGRNGFEKWFDNLVNPAMVTVPSALADPVRDEATRLYEETKNTTAFMPKISMSYLNVGDHVSNTKEYTEFLQIADSAMHQAASTFIESGEYQSLPTAQREKALGSIYSAIQTVERAKFLDLDTEFDGAEKAYAEGGEEALFNYVTGASFLSEIGVDNTEKARLDVLDRYAQGGADAIQQLVDMHQQIVDAGGYSSYGMITNFEKAKDTIPGLTAQTFVNTYKMLDVNDSHDIAQGEMLDYLNQNPTYHSEEGVDRLWNAYGDEEWTSIPYFNAEDGVWKTRKNPEIAKNELYDQVTQTIPSLSRNEFDQILTDVDTDDSATITQKELLDYFGRYNFTDEDVMTLWQAFGNDWKRQPTYNPRTGTWSAK